MCDLVLWSDVEAVLAVGAANLRAAGHLGALRDRVFWSVDRHDGGVVQSACGARQADDRKPGWMYTAVAETLRVRNNTMRQP